MLKELACLRMVIMAREKKRILNHNRIGCKEEKMLHRKHKSHRFELPLKKQKKKNKLTR